jgi:hypothetical protein
VDRKNGIKQTTKEGTENVDLFESQQRDENYCHLRPHAEKSGRYSYYRFGDKIQPPSSR